MINLVSNVQLFFFFFFKDNVQLLRVLKRERKITVLTFEGW